MNTSAVNNPLPILPSAGNGKPALDASADSGAFGQALSQEISNRNEGSKASSNDGSKDATKNVGDKNSNDGKTKSADESKPVDKDKSTAAADKKTDDKDDDKSAENPAAGIMAFVAHLTQNHKLATDSASDTKLAITDKLKAGADKAVAAAKPDLTAAADTNEKAAKQADFLSTLEKVASGTTEGSKASLGTQAETFAPLLAASSQTLAPNSTALQRANELQTMQANTFSQQVGSADWDKALGQKVVWMVQGAQTSATMTLNPPDLGPMQITLNVNNNNQATANFVAHHPEVRHALENAMPRLREMLGDAGIQLGQSNVSAGTSDQQAAFENGRHSSRRSSAAETASPEAPLHVSHIRTPGASDGMVDTFA